MEACRTCPWVNARDVRKTRGASAMRFPSRRGRFLQLAFRAAVLAGEMENWGSAAEQVPYAASCARPAELEWHKGELASDERLIFLQAARIFPSQRSTPACCVPRKADLLFSILFLSFLQDHSGPHFSGKYLPSFTITTEYQLFM